MREKPRMYEKQSKPEQCVNTISASAQDVMSTCREHNTSEYRCQACMKRGYYYTWLKNTNKVFLEMDYFLNNYVFFLDYPAPVKKTDINYAILTKVLRKKCT